MNPNGLDWDLHIRCLLTALVGVISSNFRMITLSYSDDIWLVEFTLEKKDPSDLEEIQESVFEYNQGIEANLSYWPEEWDYKFSMLVSSPIKSKITITSAPIKAEKKEQYVVMFKRREF